jgi:hypothetical protein
LPSKRAAIALPISEEKKMIELIELCKPKETYALMPIIVVVNEFTSAAPLPMQHNHSLSLSNFMQQTNTKREKFMILL